MQSYSTTHLSSVAQAVPSRFGFVGGVCTLFWLVYILLNPVYVFPSGVPQPSDWLCAFLVGVLFFAGRFRLDGIAKPVVRRLGAFIAYCLLVNLTWAIILWAMRPTEYFAGLEMLMASAYYFFNLLVTIVAISMMQWLGAKFVNVFVFAVIASSLFQASMAWLTGSTDSNGTRTTVFFENPNQLAYFAVLNASLLIALAKTGLVHRLLMLLYPIAFCGLLYIAIASSSRAGLAGVGLACLIMYVDNIRNAILVTVVLGLVALSGFWTSSATTLVDRSIEKNMGLMEELAYRGYDRLWNHPAYLVFGGGEGDYERLNSVAQYELHSTPGTILFSYGIVGSILFLAPLIYIWRRRGIGSMLLILPVITYGLTHQGLRQSEFWILLVLIACAGQPGGIIAEDEQDEREYTEQEQDEYEYDEREGTLDEFDEVVDRGQ